MTLSLKKQKSLASATQYLSLNSTRICVFLNPQSSILLQIIALVSPTPDQEKKSDFSFLD